MIEVTVNGVKELQADLKALPEEMETRVIGRMAQIAFDSAFRAAGRHSKTGALVQSLDNKPIPGGRRVFHDTFRAPQAVFVQFGTKAHPIVPKNKKALRWPLPGLGGFQFAKKVNHPGTKADPYMRRAADEALSQFDAIVTATLKDSL